MNRCVFSPDNKYRYVLESDITQDALKTPTPYRTLIVTMLNPSLANHDRLDPKFRDECTCICIGVRNPFCLVNHHD